MQLLHKHSYILSLPRIALIVGNEEKALFIVNNFLENPSCFKNISGFDFYCGKYKESYVFVIACNSNSKDIDLLTRVLFSSNIWNIELLIRISSCLSLNKMDDNKTLYLASEIFYYDKYFEENRVQNKKLKQQSINKELEKDFLKKSKNLNIDISTSSIYIISSNNEEKDLNISLLNPKPKNTLFIDMNSDYLYRNSEFYGKRVVSLFTNSKLLDLSYDMEESSINLKSMVLLALETSTKYM